MTIEESTKPVAKLADVAKLAGCSLATASRVMNGNVKVGAADKARVMAAAMELSYVPNQSARSLRSTKSSLVGAIIPTLDYAIYATMINAMQAELADKGVSLIINTSGYDLDMELKQARLLVSRGVDYLVLVGSEHRPETIELLKQAKVPCVFTYTINQHAGAASIGFNNELAGMKAARYLLQLGHRKMAMIAGRVEGNDRVKDRIRGYLSALADAGIDQADVNLVESEYTVEGGRNSMRRLMQAAVVPTAIFCGSDILAAGAMKYCKSNGIRVPEDVSIVGFDNLEIAELLTPELTTLEVPAKEMGTLIAEMITSGAKGSEFAQVKELSTQLILRDSTGRAVQTIEALSSVTS